MTEKELMDEVHVAQEARESRRKNTLVIVVALIAMLVSLASAGLVLYSMQHQAAVKTGNALDAQRTQFQVCVKTHKHKMKVTKSAYCEKPVSPPAKELIKSIPGERGFPGLNGLNGKNGRPPTAGEVLTAINLYCASRNDCIGPIGRTGSGGPVGKPGATVIGPAGGTGPSGGPGVDGKSGANGKDGQKGDTGDTGATGTGVQHVTCTAPSAGTQFTIFYTDGTSETIECDTSSVIAP